MQNDTLKALEKCFQIANNLRSDLLTQEQDSFFEESIVDNYGEEFSQSSVIDSLDEIRTELDLLIGKLSQ